MTPSRPPATLRHVPLRFLAGVGGAWVLVLGAFLLPEIALDGTLALVAHGVAESGGWRGAPIVVALGLLLVVTRPGRAARDRVRELLVGGAALGLLLGGYAALNEHVLKPSRAAARPNIEELAQSGALGLSADDFYALGNKEDRREYLGELLRAPGFHAVELHPRIREHWIEETGYSFPSGHATAAFTTLTFFLGVGLVGLRGWRLRLLAVLGPWAIAVCYSRPLLRVHSAADVATGAAQGIGLGVLAALLVYALAMRTSATSSS